MPEGYHHYKDCPVVGNGKGQCPKCLPDPPKQRPQRKRPPKPSDYPREELGGE